MYETNKTFFINVKLYVQVSLLNKLIRSDRSYYQITTGSYRTNEKQNQKMKTLNNKIMYDVKKTQVVEVENYQYKFSFQKMILEYTRNSCSYYESSKEKSLR